LYRELGTFIKIGLIQQIEISLTPKSRGFHLVTSEIMRQYREEHWEQDLQRAFDAGKRMAEKIA